MKEAPLSGVIYAVLVIVWACVLVPMWVRRNDGETEDIVSSPSRILPRRRLPAEQRPATRSAEQAGVSGAASGSSVASGTGTGTGSGSRVAASAPEPRRPLTPAERRQRLFIAVCALAGLPALLFVAGLVPAAVAVVGALPLAGYGALRYSARGPDRTPAAPARTTGMTAAPPKPAETSPVGSSAARTSAARTPAARTSVARTPATETPAARRPAVGTRGARADQSSAPAQRRVADVPAEPVTTTAAAEEVFDLEQYEEAAPARPPRTATWSPVPVPLPTYLSSRRGPAAPRRRPPAAAPAPAHRVRETGPAPRRAVND